MLKVNAVTIEFTPPPWRVVAQGQPSITETSGGCGKCQRTLGQEVFPIRRECVCVYVCVRVCDGDTVGGNKSLSRVEKMSCYFGGGQGFLALCLGLCRSNIARTSHSNHFNNGLERCEFSFFPFMGIFTPI